MPQRLEPTYREALAEAWRFVGTHKFLWLLGAVAAVLGEFGFTSFIGRLWRLFTEGASSADFWWLPTSLHGFSDVRLSPALDSLAIIMVAVALLLFIIVAGILAQGAIISSALTFFRTKKIPTIAVAWNKSVHSFWHLFGIKLLENFFLSIFLFLVVALWAILPTDLFFFALIRGVILVAAVLGGVTISAVSVFASAYTIDKNYTIQEALREGWALFAGHVLTSIELSFIFLLLTGFVVGAVCLAAYGVVVFGLLFMVLGAVAAEPTITMLGVMLSGFLFVVATAVIGGFFNAYVLCAWMYCYIKMHRTGIPSRLLHYKAQLMGSK